MSRLRAWNQRRIAWGIEAGYRLCEWLVRKMGDDYDCRKGGTNE